MLPKPHGINLNDWRITSTKAPISNSDELERIRKDVGLPSIPEMVFGKNCLRFLHEPTGFELSFNAQDAIALVSHQPPDIRVAASANWIQKNKEQVAAMAASQPQGLTQFSFDWTFTTPYTGTIHSSNHEVKIEAAPELSIPKDKLTAPEPILFFDEVHLFEDELADNGIAQLSVKCVRHIAALYTTPASFTHYKVLFRIRDTRVYHEYGTNFILREITHREDVWQNIATRCDVKEYIDSNAMASILPIKSITVEKVVFA